MWVLFSARLNLRQRHWCLFDTARSSNITVRVLTVADIARYSMRPERTIRDMFARWIADGEPVVRLRGPGRGRPMLAISREHFVRLTGADIRV
jgi:hypothetical protein